MKRRRWTLTDNWLLTLPIGVGGSCALLRQFWVSPPHGVAEWFVAACLVAFCLLMLRLTFERK